LDPAKFDQMLMCTVAHEITHLLFERITGTFTDKEHTNDPDGDGNTMNDAEDESCLMYKLPTLGRHEIATVRFFPVVQVELKVKSNQAFVLSYD
jgi:hypothetical protein